MERIPRRRKSPAVLATRGWCFNGVNAANLGNPAFAGGRAQIPYCGDDAGAKGTVCGIIEAIGFEALDCGELKNARYLEALAMLWIQLAFVEG